ncbi:MAG: hypothetical protein K9J27_11115 [Bacteroidales bacterium]|nr:hypothetical protein [Bacteroidales bacterium]MCF8334341.1 hypothetical protein [Bacteroidales bacterium]
MGRIILLIIVQFMFVASSVLGQTREYDLSEFELPDLRRPTLDLDFQFSGNSDRDNFRDYYSMDNRSSNSHGLEINADYNFYLNTDKKQYNTNITLDLSSGISVNKEDSEKIYENKKFNSRLSLDRVNRYYYQEGRFYEINANIGYFYQWDKNLEYKDRRYAFSGSIPLKIGLGRLEYVTDARHAMYIFDELADEGRLSEKPDKAEIEEFANLIARLKNKRFFDSRIRRIEELKGLDSALVAGGFTDQTDARYFTTLNDYWVYGGRPERQSGTRYSLAFIPGYYLSGFKRNPETDTTDAQTIDEERRAYSLNAGVQYERRKPVNRYWQNDITVYGFVGIYNAREQQDEGENESKLPNLNVTYSQSWGYYPNTRTSMNLAYSLKYARIFDKADEENNISSANRSGFRGGLSFGVHYYISPKLRLNVSGNLSYYWHDPEDNDYMMLSNQIGTIDRFNPTKFYWRDWDLKDRLGSHYNVSLKYSLF